jgi:DNA modification methylase
MVTANLTIRQGDCRDVLPTLEEVSVQCCVTSPPYFGLRDYGTASWEGGEAGCDHQRLPEGVKIHLRASTLEGGQKTNGHQQEAAYKDICGRCGARRIDSQLGLEQTPEEYVANMVGVFREVWRVLRDDGTLWLNLGDSFGVGTNITDCIASRIKGSVLFVATACTLTVTSEGEDILRPNKGFPNGEFVTLFGVKRVFFKQRDDNFCQILNFLESKSCLRIGRSISITRINQSDVEILFDSDNHISVVVAEHYLDTNTPLKVSIFPGTAKDAETTFAVKEASEPMAEGITNTESIRNAASLYSFRESVLKVDSINDAVSFGDAVMPNSEGLCNFTVTKSSGQKLALSLVGGGVKITFSSVRHLYFLDSKGSFIRYASIYDKAYRDLRENGSKQELGIPFLVRRALMRDGWICRSTIIWHKPNPMPESVIDRPTKSHEYLFLLAKQERYFYDAEAIQEEITGNTVYRLSRAGPKYRANPTNGDGTPSSTLGFRPESPYRSKRSVWTIATQPYAEAHFATFPEDLVKPCILAGSRPGDVVLDPFAGSGTIGKVALELGRSAVLIELSPDYCELARDRTNVTPGFVWTTAA